ncbi:hypothetical protein P692DRAFT_20690504, partial [Suillus brevipes Sb2]
NGPCSIRVIEGAVTPRTCPARLMRVHILVSITSRFKLDLCLLDDYTVSFRTPRFMRACSSADFTQSRVLRRNQMSVSIMPFWRYKRWTVAYLAR